MTSSWRLYVIVDRAAAGGRDLADCAAAAIRGGADVIQLRDKAASHDILLEEAARLLPIARAAGARLPMSRWLSRAPTSSRGLTGSRLTVRAIAWRSARARRNSVGDSKWKRTISSHTRSPSSARFAFASIKRKTAFDTP